MERLAIHGGVPVRPSPIYYGHQYIDEDDLRAVRDVLMGDYLTTGPSIDELEHCLCDITGARYAVALSNGTAALHAACYVADIKKGDEVITTPMTFAATANSILYCRGKPVFADIDQATYNIDPAAVRKAITPRTKAVIAVDFTGQPAQVDVLRSICREKNLLLIEDAAHSIGSSLHGVPVGALADLTTFSFHPVKTVTGGEGGAVLTDSWELCEKLRIFRTHGITRNPTQMEGDSEGSWYYQQTELGYNYRITDFQAALIISQLKKLGRFSARRQEIVRQYNTAFREIPEVMLQREISGADTVHHLYILQLNLSMLSAGRREIVDALTAENVVPNVHYIPVYYHPYYKRLGYEKGICPHAERLYEGIISIPLYYSMSDEDVKDVIAAVKKVIQYFKR